MACVRTCLLHVTICAMACVRTCALIHDHHDPTFVLTCICDMSSVTVSSDMVHMHHSAARTGRTLKGWRGVQEKEVV